MAYDKKKKKKKKNIMTNSDMCIGELKEASVLMKNNYYPYIAFHAHREDTFQNFTWCRTFEHVTNMIISQVSSG